MRPNQRRLSGKKRIPFPRDFPDENVSARISETVDGASSLTTFLFNLIEFFAREKLPSASCEFIRKRQERGRCDISRWWCNSCAGEISLSPAHLGNKKKKQQNLVSISLLYWCIAKKKMDDEMIQKKKENDVGGTT